ncbi:N-acetyltransferase [Bombiscardovia apis]|uniref:Probable N-acetyltransferase 14 n=2 Tax=Bombiscardovia apis TaxID=2932182 RepID=A0ABN6SH60_9BIFI|nr:N-acetyltransferase [Bombiscardovia apis]
MQLLLSADPSQAAIEAYIGKCELHQFRADNQLTGVLALLPTRPETMEIVNIAVAQDYQQQGLGTHMVRFAQQRAAQLGMKRLEVGTGSTSFAALALYQKCGLRMSWIDRDYFVDRYPEPLTENGIPLRDMVRLSCPIPCATLNE